MKKVEQYRLHPMLLVYATTLKGRRTLVAETASGEPPLVIRDPRFAWALTLLPSLFTEASALEAWSSEQELAPIACDLWHLLFEHGLVVVSSSDDPAPSRWRLWHRYQWAEAYAYQESTRDYPFLKMDEPDAFRRDDDRMRAYVEESPPPPIYLELPSEERIRLRKLHREESAQATLDSLGSRERRGLPGLSLLFDVCFGERTQKSFNVQGSFLRKSIPSGGARHPTEVFMVAFERAAVEPGVYHYNVENHALDRLRSGDFFERSEHATFDLFQKLDAPPFGLLVFTSLFERAMWRYRDARSWRAPLVDVGHALMAFRTLSAALDYRWYTYQKVRDRELCQLLGISPFRLTPLFTATLV